MFSKQCFTKQIELHRTPRIRASARKLSQLIQPVTTLSHRSNPSSGQERRAMSMAGSTRRNAHEEYTQGAFCGRRRYYRRARHGSGNNARASAGQNHYAVLGCVGSRQCAGRTIKGLHRQNRYRHEIRIRAVAELCRPFPERTQFTRVVVRSHHRRFPVDRRRRRERSVRQAQ